MVDVLIVPTYRSWIASVKETGEHIGVFNVLADLKMYCVNTYGNCRYQIYDPSINRCKINL